MQYAASSFAPLDVLPVRRLIVMDASDGGLHSLFTVLEHLPASLDCCIAVATHFSPTHHNSMIPELLGNHARMPMRRASNEPLRNGTIFVAPLGFHLVVQVDDPCLLDEPLHFVHPNIDLFFQSVAASFGANAVAVILSGTSHDGSEGVRAIKATGGTIFVEDPINAEFNDMSIAANRTGCVDFVFSLKQISEQLMEVCSKPSIWRTPST